MGSFCYRETFISPALPGNPDKKSMTFQLMVSSNVPSTFFQKYHRKCVMSGLRCAQRRRLSVSQSVIIRLYPGPVRRIVRVYSDDLLLRFAAQVYHCIGVDLLETSIQCFLELSKKVVVACVSY